MAGGWFHSGDLCRYDKDGFVYVVDRLKDMIISGGENIYCLEVESALRTHPKVAEVTVAGVPHEKWGETPAAFVIPADPADPPSLDELTEHIAGALARYKRPTAVMILDELPRNSAGKVLRPALRARYAERLAQSAADH
jgi:acyl-CoA synthetase (AMP-forming)/AMP-acid ligase II